MRWWICGLVCGLGALGLVSCGGPRDVVEVKEFHLKEVDPSLGESEVVRGEELKRLYGAVTPAERREKVAWKAPWMTPGTSCPGSCTSYVSL